MPNKKITDLPAATVPLAGTEKAEIVQGGINVQVEVSEFGGGGGGTVTSVTGTTNRIAVDNTNPATPVINIDAAYDAAVTAAINAKVVNAINNGATTTAPSEDAVFDALALKAPLASPALTGTPTTPTAAPGTGGTQIASQAYADAANVNLVYASSGTNDYTASPAGITALTAGVTTIINFANANTLPYPTLNINGLGARLIKKQINVDLSIGDIGTGSTYVLYYNGTFWQILNDIDVKRLYNVERYGARHDYKTVSDANVTSGTATLTSATAAFTTNDTGKTMRVCGAGAAGADLITTITFVNATTVTLGTNASTTITAKQIEWGTDSTTGINSAIGACHIDGGGTVYFPNGIYLIAGAFITSIDGVNPNCQILIPLSNTSSTTYKSIHLLGESIPNPLLSGLGNTGITKVMTGAVLKSIVVGSGTLPSVIGSSFVDAGTDYNLTGVVFENITIQVKSRTGVTHVAPTVTHFNMRVLTWAAAINCAAMTESDPFQESVQPSTLQYGFYFPQTSEAQHYMTGLGQNSAIGCNTGFRIAEHELDGRLNAVCCERGVEFFGAVTPNHPNFATICTVWCINDLVFTGPITVNLDYYNERYGAGKWYQHSVDILFTGTPQVEGKINAHIMTSGGTHNAPTSSGAFTGRLKVTDLYTNTDYYFNSATYTEEALGGFGIQQTISRNGAYQNKITNTSTGTAASSATTLGNSTALLTQLGFSSSGYTGSAFLGASGSFQYTDSPIGHSFWLADTGTPVFKIGFGATPTEVFRLTNTGRLFLGGSTTPTAVLHLSAVTTARASLCITPGTTTTAPSSPVSGDVWHEGTNNRLMFRKGASSQEFMCAVQVNTVNPTAPDRTIQLTINGTTFYIAAKTTND